LANNLEYTHSELNESLPSLAGHYTLQKEVRLSYNNREVLYVVGQAVIEASCCSSGNWAYIFVPGYIVNWQYKTNEADRLVSEVEPIPASDSATRAGISQIIIKAESISRIEFW
jgi:hypothetical protein